MILVDIRAGLVDQYMAATGRLSAARAILTGPDTAPGDVTRALEALDAPLPPAILDTIKTPDELDDLGDTLDTQTSAVVSTPEGRPYILTKDGTADIYAWSHIAGRGAIVSLAHDLSLPLTVLSRPYRTDAGNSAEN